MKNREHDDTLRLSWEEHGVRNATESHTTNLTMNDLVMLGILVGFPDCVVKLRHKPLPEPLEL